MSDIEEKNTEEVNFEDETEQTPQETASQETGQQDAELADTNAEENGDKIDDDEATTMLIDRSLIKQEEKPEEEPAEISSTGDLTGLKRKKKKADLAGFEKQLKEGDGDSGNEDHDVFAQDNKEEEDKSKVKEAWLGSDRDYLYDELLTRVFDILRANNPELAGEKKRYTIVPPSVHRDGNKKTVFANVSDICKRMHRQPEHVIQFLFAELGTSGSIDGAQRLVIRGKFQQKQIENVLRRYIVEYVTCKTCKSPDTILTKENRIFFQQCESCGSTRSVSAIKTGFKAQTEKRAAQRRAAAQ
ncbi:5592_t:CDS:2 [Paraglomus brasilianum]|uniref:5592_t:CDS:1 n=1 Tax=Paraglomus brasilianum TaxID=144538 RepID=A0A9N9A548_9GLOM|nr:5592_t:CDS:2 [Paraglomus brasilianum]